MTYSPAIAHPNSKLETVMEAWLRSKGIQLVEVSPQERNAAAQRLARLGDPSKRRALRMVALWSLAPVAAQTHEHLSVRDMADFILCEGFAIEDSEGLRTLHPQEYLLS